MLLYHHGSLRDALESFGVSRRSLRPAGWFRAGRGAGAHAALSALPQRCLQLEPDNEVCQYMKGLSHVAMGQFYDGIKAQTKVMLSDPLPGQKASPEHLKVKYLRGESQRRGSLRLALEAVETGCSTVLRVGEAEQPVPSPPGPSAGAGPDRARVS